MSQHFFLIALLSAVIFLIALLKTDFAFIILIFSMLFSPELHTGGGVPGRAVVVRFDDIFIFIIFFGWLAKMAMNKELGFLRVNRLNRPIIIYIFISIIATLLGALRGEVNIRHGFFYLLKYIEYFLLFFMVVNNIRSVKQAKTFVFFILLTCFLVGLYGWMNIGTGERLSAPFEEKGGEANTLAGYLLLMMGIITGLILYSETNKQRFILLGLLGFIFVPFLYTLSRGAWIAVIPMGLSLIIMAKKGKGIVLFGFLVLIMLLPVILPQRVHKRVEETFNYGQTYKVFGKKITLDESAVSRIDSWKYAFEQWKKRPILGYGVPAGSVVDNQYARVIREVGIIGSLSYIWLMVMIFKIGAHTYKVSLGNNNFASGLSLGFIAAFFGLLTQSFSAETFIIVRIMEPFWFLTALVVMLAEICTEN